jgi:putative flippase GtrA
MAAADQNVGVREMERSNIGVQFGWYLVVGGLSTVVDIGGFWLLRQLGLSMLLASPTSFLSGTVCNYFLSYTLAFTRGRHERGPEVGAFAIVVLVGLILNSGFAFLFVSWGAAEVLAKTAAVPCVLAWNFLGRRWFVFHPEIPGQGPSGSSSSLE